MFGKMKKAMRTPPLQVVRFFAMDPEDMPGDDAETPPWWSLRYSVFGRKKINFTPGVKFRITRITKPRKNEKYGWFEVKVLNNKGREVAAADLYIDDFNTDIYLLRSYMQGRTLVVVDQKPF